MYYKLRKVKNMKMYFGIPRKEFPEFTNKALLAELAIAYERALYYSDDPEKFRIWEQRYDELVKVALSRMKE